MPTHVALLKGVNVGGHNRVPMADLRRVATELGLKDVATYVQSGNLVFSTQKATATVKAELEQAIAEAFNVTCDVVVLTRAQLAEAIEANPFPVRDPKKLHLAFRSSRLTKDEIATVDAAQAKSDEKGGKDRAAVVGATVYIDTPDGIGRSDLAARLGRTSGAGTARNWTTVTKLVELLDR